MIATLRKVMNLGIEYCRDIIVPYMVLVLLVGVGCK